LYLLIFLQVITVNLFSKHNIQEFTIEKPNEKIIVVNKKIFKNKYFKLPKDSKITVNHTSLSSPKVIKYFEGVVKVKKSSDRFLIFQELELNDYLFAVILAELNREVPIEALKAFYLVVKNYTLMSLQRHKSIKADFCDIAHCQLYNGNTTPQAPKTGVFFEEDLALLLNKKIYYKNKLAFTPYSSSCGKYTCSSKDIWSREYEYLKGRTLNTNLAPWVYKLKKTDLKEILGIDLINKFTLKKGCVYSIGENSKTKSIIISGENFRRKINQELGWNKIKSNVFTIKKYKNYYLIKGSGFGHNVGFCIKEAIILAEQGYNYIDILNYFFEGIEVK